MTIKYTKSGLWVEKLEDSYCLGLSVKGQDDVGDVMYAELPDIERDSHLTKDENLLSVEGAKAVTEIVSPLSGTVKDVHKEVEDDTELLNSTDRAENWIDRKSTRLNSSHVSISYAVFCLKKKK